MSTEFGLNKAMKENGVQNVAASETGRIAMEMTSLYKDSVNAIFQDDTMVFHVLPMPEYDGESFISAKGVDPDLDLAAEAICESDINDMDCVVVLGADVLKVERTEDEMAQIAIEHLSNHLDNVWPVADANMGMVRKTIGSTVFAGLLTCAHPVLAAIDSDGEIINSVKEKAITALAVHKFHANIQTATAITRICEEAVETNGGFLALPANITDLVSAGREVFCDVVDRMETRPMGVI